MNLTQYLCTLLSEECNELGQRASKLSRFGQAEVQPGQELDNFERMRLEKVDVLVVYSLLLAVIGRSDEDPCHINNEEKLAKQHKIIEFTRLSVACGQISQSVLDELITYTLCERKVSRHI